MATAYLALGSSLGNRLRYLQGASQALMARGVFVDAHSKIYESQSVESGGDGDFLNAVLRVQTELSAPELLELCQQIEVAAGREAATPGEHRGGPRALDIDILLFVDERWNTPQLEIPHPRALHRAFVLKPLLDVLEGGWVKETELSF
jgi:2-amino-4-hydroxy-6-hydroxymethyldihydropteridine diphosphokinase